jgi:hypothetical protein
MPDLVTLAIPAFVGTYNPVNFAFHEWLQMFRDAWMAPGWRNKLL